MKKLLTIIGLAAASLAGVNAAVLIQDNFPTNGSLVGTTPSVGGNWQNVSGTADTLLVSGNKLQIQDDNSEDAESDFSSTQSVSLFAGFTLNMSSGDLPSTGGEYFSSFRNGTSYNGRIFAYRPSGTAAGKFRLGISNNGASVEAGWATDLDTLTDYRVVVKFTQNGANDFVTLWVGPTNEASTSVSTSAAAINTSLSAFSFRQASSTGDMSIDNLVVADTFAQAVPEPKTWALIGIGASFMLWNLRRRRRILG